MQKPLFAGIDVGGTNIKLGLVDDAGQIVAQTKFPTQPDRSPDGAVEEAHRELSDLLEGAGAGWDDVAAAGVGTPGPLDIEAGLILTPTNLPGWHQYPIRKRVQVVRKRLINRPITCILLQAFCRNILR